MATHIGIGYSQNTDAETAVRQAVSLAKSNLHQDRIDACVVFYTAAYHPQKTLPILKSLLSNAPMVGCCAPGIILSEKILSSGFTIALISSEDWEVHAGASTGTTLHEPQTAGSVIAKSTIEKFGIRGRHAMLFFCDGNITSEKPLIKGMQDILGNVFTLVGAGTFEHSQAIPQIYEQRIMDHSITGLMFGGHSRMGVGGRHGWKPLGKPRRITAAFGNIIQSIDNKPASNLYKEYFPENFDNIRLNKDHGTTALYPLGILIEATGKYLLKNPVNFLEDGSIVCQGDIPVGEEVHIMISHKESCYEAARQAAEEAKKNLLGQKAKIIFVLESFSRMKLIGRSRFQQIREIQKVFGDVPLIGIYTNGEVFPFQSSDNIYQPYLQNKNIVVAAIS